MVALCVVALFGGGDAGSGWEAYAVSLLKRLPIAAPLIWLAIVAVKQLRRTQRVEEDYGFKEVVSTAFEGFRRELAAIEDDSPETVKGLAGER